MLSGVEVVGHLTDARHVLGEVDDVARHDSRDVVPLVLVVGEGVEDEAVLDLLSFDFVEQFLLLFPLVDLHKL